MSESFAASYRRLSAAQKGHARGAPGYSVYVNRRIGRVLAAAAHRWGLTPNQVTMISAAHTFAAIVVLLAAPAAWWTGVIVAVLLALGYAWDSADGQLARLRGGGSLAGEWLDHFVDAVKIASLHLAVLVALWLHTPYRDTVWMLVPLLFSVVGVVTFFGMLLNDLLKGKKGVASTHARGGGTFVRSMILVPTDYGLLCLLFALWGATAVFLWAYAVLMVLNAVFLVLAAAKWFREIRALDRTLVA
jgi:phosphatidylglycerophosphate synthase